MFSSFVAQACSSLCVDMPVLIRDDDRCSKKNLSLMAEDNFALRQDLYKYPKGLAGPETHTQVYPTHKKTLQFTLRVYDALSDAVTDPCHT